VGTATVASGIIAGLHDSVGWISDLVTQAKTLIVDVAGIPAHWVLPIGAVGAGIIVIWNRYKQRIKGWA
jgi:hypothetical protein